MRYKALYNSVDFQKEEDLLGVLLRDRGVDDVKGLLKVDSNCIYDGMLIENMSKGLKLLHKWLIKAKRKLVKIHVIVDEDADGYTSASTVINYIKDIVKQDNLLVEVTYTVHGSKIHGIKLEELEELECDLLIIPDAGTNDTKECKVLLEEKKCKEILILDHHNIERINPYATIINCKDGKYPNSGLCGMGVTYKFIKEYDKAYKYDYADKYLDLVAVGTIGDQMDLKVLETRYLTLQGIKQLGKNNQFLNQIIEKQSFSIGDNVNITKVGWNVTPVINGVTRVGTPDERLQTFRAIVGEEAEMEYKPRKSKNNPNPVPEMQSLQQYMARECTNIKARQDRIAKKGMEELSKTIEVNEYDKDKIIIVEATDEMEKGFSGLIANKLQSKYKRPVLVLKSMNKEIFGGSGRNYSLSPIVDLNAFLTGLNLFEEVAGHDNAFGIKIKKYGEQKKIIAKTRNIKRFPYKGKFNILNSNYFIPNQCHFKIDWINKLRNIANEALKDVEMEDTYKVDYEIPIGRLKPRQVEQVGGWVDLWGNGLEEPMFAITDIYIKPEDVKLLGEKKNTIKIETRNITFIKKYANEEIYNKMIMRNSKGLNKKKKNSRIKMTCVCKFGLNEWEGNVTPQCEIMDFDVKQDSEVRF